MILIDTNILLRAAQPGHPHCDEAMQAVKTARMRGYVPCIVPQVIYEYWVVATRPVSENGLGMTTSDVERDVVQLTQQFHLFRDERTIFDRWRALVVQHHIQGKTAHDTRLVAAMDRHGIKHLLTFNVQDFKRFLHIAVMEPGSVERLQPQ